MINIDISKLKVGQIVKNYKELCELLNEKTTTGNAKIYQLKRLEDYISYHKDGYRFIVDEIYKECKEHSKRGSKSIYKEDIERLIVDMLAQDETKEGVFLSIGLFLRSLNLINDNYMMGKRYTLKLSELTDVSSDVCEEFYNATHDKLKGMLERALNSLRSKALVYWTKVMTVCVEEIEPLYNSNGKLLFDKNGNIEVKRKVVYREATDEETKFILKTEKILLIELELENLQEVVARGLWKKYINTVNKRAYEEYNIKFFYDSYSVIYNYEYIKREQIKIKNDFILSNKERNDVKDTLNQKVIDGLNQSAERKQLKAQKKIDDFEKLEKDILYYDKIVPLEEFQKAKPKEIDFQRERAAYIEDNEKLINTVIKQSSNDIRNKLREPVKQKHNLGKAKPDKNLPF